MNNAGAWWEDAWWEKENGAQRYTVHEIRSAIDELRKHFDAAWVASAIQNPKGFHPVVGHLCFVRGLVTEEALVALARILATTSACPGFTRKLAELKSERYHSARHEMHIASVIANAGLEVRFVKGGKGKSADLLATDDGLEVAVECKRLQTQQWEQWTSELMNRMIMSLPQRVDGKPAAVDIVLDERLSEIFLDSQFDDINGAIIEGIVARVRTRVESLITVDGVSFTDIPGVGHAKIVDELHGHGSITGAPVSRIAKLRRILRQGLFEAVEQLHSYEAGIAVVQCDFAGDPGLTRTVFDAITSTRRSAYERLLALVVMPTPWKQMGSYPVIVPNSNSFRDPFAFRTVRALTDGLGLEVV